MRIRTMGLFWLALASVLGSACGGDPAGDSAQGEIAGAESSAGSEAGEAEDDEGVQVEGILGTIAASSIERAVNMRLNRFLRCATRRYDHVEVLSGTFAMSFRVKRDGTVRWVFPVRSTIGDRQTERCMIEVAAQIRFDRPRGGEAEFQHSFDLPLLDDVRAPVEWEDTRVSATLAEQGRSARACRSEASFLVTTYI
ncbi:MAG: AgmX/PglI C-terminal domain-containing protein, partial [Myxococcales bacterium]|nr:AgmX/PglI C-terminal domain-containing protein [Myxococcales bacterium]